MRALMLSIMAVAFIGCQSTSYQWHVEKDVVKVARVDRFPAMWTAPLAERIHQVCPLSALKEKVRKSGTGAEDVDYTQCETVGREIDGKMHDHWDFAWEPGTLNGLGGSLLTMGTFLGSSAIIANGLKHQGGRLNTGVNNSYNTTQNCYSRDCY